MALRPHGISLVHLLPLMLVVRNGPMLQVDLVKASSIGQPDMVAALRKLETSGLIERSANVLDRRSATINLTQAG